MPLQIQSGSSFELTVPGDFTELKLQMTNIYLSGIFNTNLDVPFTVLDQNLIWIPNLNSALAGQGKISLMNLRNPSVVRPTGSFKLVLRDSAGYVVG